MVPVARPARARARRPASPRPLRACLRAPRSRALPPRPESTAGTTVSSHGRRPATSRSPRSTVRSPQQPRHVAHRPRGSGDGPGDLRPADTRRVAHADFLDAPARVRCAQDHLERPPEPAIDEIQREQALATGRAHRPEVTQLQRGPAAELHREQAVGDPRVHRPRPGRRLAGAEHEVRATVEHRRRDARQIPAVERAVAIHEADDVGGCRSQTGEACGAEPSCRLRDDARTGATRDLRSAVGRAVVDDDRRVSRWQTGKDHRDRSRFVEGGQDDIRHRFDRNDGDPRPVRFACLRFAKLLAPAGPRHRLARTLRPMLDVRAPARSTTARALTVWGGLVASAVIWGRVLVLTGARLDVASPPFWSRFEPHPGPGVLPATAVAAILAWKGPTVARTLAWR